ncbi:hypothetical protein Ddc_09450 [Ditylenchus destructor]|nr:hypothetical protein Ddc_09450 [Ditylenchus destructor]
MDAGVYVEWSKTLNHSQLPHGNEALDLLLASAHSIQQQLASVVSIKPSSLLPEILKHFNDNSEQKCEPRPS